MPMAVSFLSAGVTWRLIYEEDPEPRPRQRRRAGHRDVVRPPGRASGRPPLRRGAAADPGQGYVTSDAFAPGDTARARPGRDPARRRSRRTPQTAAPPTTAAERRSPAPSGSTSRPAAAGSKGEIDPREKGLPASRSRRSQGDEVVASASDGAATGRSSIDGLRAGRLPAAARRRRTSASPSAGSRGSAPRW